MATYHIWTLQIAQWRLANTFFIEPLDITAKSAKGLNKEFAPHFNDVMRHKDGHLSDDQYTDIYIRKIRQSKIDTPKAWQGLKTHQRVALMCYCRAGVFCHRHLMVPEMKAYLEAEGHEVVLHGELTANGEDCMQTVPPKPEKLPELFTFFGKQDALSNWNWRKLTLKNVTFEHGEQAMMYCKAMYYKDFAKATEILMEPDPKKCKALGREVTPFNKEEWEIKSIPIVRRICLQKAREHEDIRTLLLNSGNKIIVEASKYDKFWGAGLEASNPLILNPKNWPGLNHLGESWEYVRTLLQNEIVF